MHVLQYNIKIGFKKHLKSTTIQTFFLSEDLLPLLSKKTTTDFLLMEQFTSDGSF